ncbi:AMP-binding protein [Marinagarivorans cellulosilyticus]|uniref:AMP-dependent synthetase/ligase domain-containing protein n=1 Tax=Marinagarivorans cellulosilyticus TaxID=2721545 RepID=A0AAN2BIG9_9GAMM|nr:AMP-binding protein [Marinagarivorans cellulosilyticus]BCD95985.1 hypothetical protein MARGE09_P0184 [Marinagarivorans cellulosilyticus]
MQLIDYQRFKNNIALITEDNIEISYSKLEEHVDNFIKAMGSEAGLILIECSNDLRPIICYLASLKIGMPAMLVNPKDEINIQSILSTYPISYHYSKSSGVWKLSTPEADSTVSVHPDLCVVLSTSGSTGNAKQIKLSQKNIISNAESIASYLGLTEKDRAITTLPFNYSYGLSVINSHLSAGGSVVLSESTVTEEKFWESFKQHECTSFAGVPYIYELLERTNFQTQELPSLRYFTQAGGRLSAEKVKLFSHLAKKKSAEFYVMYGQTEATARMAYLPPELAADFPDCIGVSIPGGEFNLLDDKNRTITETGIDGELIYRGPNIMMGYATKASDLLIDEKLDTLKTGDVAQINEKGLYRITGRINRFIKPFGIRLGLDELESTFENEGLSCLCTGNDDELLIAVSDTALQNQVMARALELTRLPESCVRVVIASEPPRLSNGKVDYKTLQVQFPKVEPTLTSTQGSIQDQLTAIYKARLNINDVSPQDTFKTLGGSSLTYVQTSLDIEKALGTVPDHWETRPIDELATLATSKTGRRWVSKLESSSVVRCYSVLAVVINHAGLSFMAGGAALLLLVSGLNLLRFQWEALLNGNTKSFFKSMTINVLLPYWTILIILPILKGDPINFPAIFLVMNNIPDTGVVPLPAWFICALAQSIFITALPIMYKPLRNWVRDNGFSYAGILLTIAIAARVMDQYFKWGETYGLSGKEITWCYWLFALGFLGFAATELRQKQIASALTIFLPIIFFPNDLSRMITVALGGLLLIWFQSINIPSLLKPMIASIGGASLFIYMLHSRAPIDSFSADWHIDIARIAIGVALGLVGWKLYELFLICSRQVIKRWMKN